jgi:hypothetical protein
MLAKRKLGLEIREDNLVNKVNERSIYFLCLLVDRLLFDLISIYDR